MKYLKLYLTIIKLSILTDLEYRWSFFVEFLASVLRVATFWIFLEIILANVGSIGGWGRFEVVLIYGIFKFFQTLLQSVIFFNMRNTIGRIVDGYFDTFLIKPVNVLFYMSFNRIIFGQLVKIIPIIMIIWYALSNLDVSFSIIQLFNLLLTVALLLITFYSMMLIFVSSSFWLGRIDHGFWIYETVLDVAQLPKSVFKGVWEILFVFAVPFVLFGAFPAGIILGKFDTFDLLPFVGIALAWWILARWVWNRGLASYTSGGG